MISREDNLSVLNRLSAIYARQPSVPYEDRRLAAREFAALYAKEIVPRIKEGDAIPLRGANSLGTLAATIASVRTLELLTLDLPDLSRISTDLSSEIVSYGDTLKTRIVGIPSVVTYNQSTGWAASDKVDVDVPIIYNQYKGVQITLDAQSIAGTVRHLFEETAPAQAYALGKSIVDYVYTLITAANFPGVTLAASSTGVAVPTIAAGLGAFGRSTIIDLGGCLDDNANPQKGRTLILNRIYHSGLKKDTAIVSLATYQKPEIIEAGLLPYIEDFSVIKAVNLPATAIGTQTLKGFAFTKSALVLASRLSANYMNTIPGAGNGLLTVISTPSGFSGNQVQFVDNNKATANQRLEVIYGAAAGQPNAGQILTDV